MTWIVRTLCLSVLVSLTACDGPTRADGGTDDGGSGHDGGSPSDGGATDSGPRTDAALDGGGGGAVCGDRVIVAPEECDDGNTSAGDGCDASCRIEASATCGDGSLDGTEQCDDGNTSDGDGCSARCLVEAPSGCGDGALDLASGEQCDDGNTAPGDGCDPSCQFEALGTFCGDGTVDALEVCDDGNTTGCDGCSPTCNLTGTVTTFVGMNGMSASVDGVGTAARIRGAGVLAADARYHWFGEGAGAGGNARVRRIEVATADVVTIAMLPGPGAEGITTNGVDTVWVAGNDGTGPALYSVSTASPFTVTRLTGSAPCMSAGCYADGAPGAATFGGIRGLTWYAGYLWIVDPPAATIRRLDPATNAVVTVAGSPFAYGTADGVGSGARFNSPRYIVSDNSGMLYISDTNGQAIRTLSVATSMVGTFAGVPVAPTPPPPPAMYVDGVGSAARIHRPRGITSDGTSVYFVEFNQHTVRQGVIATQAVSTLAGTPAATGGYADGVGSAALFDGPYSVVYHFPSGSLFVADGGNQVIRRIQ